MLQNCWSQSLTALRKNILGIRMRIFASRQCADYTRARHMRVQVRRAWHVLRFAVGEASCLVFVVSKP